jgi:hypothetical protein
LRRRVNHFPVLDLRFGALRNGVHPGRHRQEKSRAPLGGGKIQRAPDLTINWIVVSGRTRAHTPNGIYLYARWLLSRVFGVILACLLLHLRAAPHRSVCTQGNRAVKLGLLLQRTPRTGELQHSPEQDGPGLPASSQQKSRGALWKSKWRKAPRRAKGAAPCSKVNPAKLSSLTPWGLRTPLPLLSSDPRASRR